MGTERKFIQHELLAASAELRALTMVSNSAGAYVGLRLEPRKHCAGLLTLEVSGR